MRQRLPAVCHPRWALAVGLILAPLLLAAQPAFEDATTSAGLTHSGETWGASWGDLNGDGYPDIFISNHREPPTLYLNRGNGTFTDVLDMVDSSGVWDAKPRQDNHGAAWADFDGDGDQDLYVTVSGGHDAPGHLLVNEGGALIDRAQEHQLAEDNHPRSAIWLDYDRDGDLDMLFMNFGSIRLFRQLGFTPIVYDREYFSGMDCSRMDYGQLSDLNGDGVMEFICGNGTFPVGVYDLTRFPFRDMTSTLPKVLRSNDSAIADFDGDLDPDLFVVTGQKHPSGVEQVNALSLEASVGVGPGVENGITFETAGLVTFSIAAKDDFNDPEFIFIGRFGKHPERLQFTLDPTDEEIRGIYPHDPDKQEGVFIGYDATLGQWRLLLSSRKNRSAGAYFEISSTASITHPKMVILEPEDLPRKPELLINTDGVFIGEAGRRGLDEKIMCISVAPGDYDNDRDVDLYLVCRDGVRNLANRLYENLGDGTFALVTGGHGAEGIQGFHLADNAGLGESVVTADYDADGCLDLFVTNGLPMRPLRHDSGPDQIFRNACDYGNHWVELDLRGRWPIPGGSNPDGVGATVYVTAGGITQMREQNGGHHRWSQSHQRLHFGLGPDQVIDEVMVVWPNGQIDNFPGAIAANRIYLAAEGAAALQTVTLGGGVEVPGMGKACGAPAIDASSERGLFLWRACPSNTWHMRVTAAGPDKQIYTGRVTVQPPFPLAPEPFSLEGNDSLNSQPPQMLLYTLHTINAGQDGFSFEAPATGQACFEADTLVYLGRNKEPMGRSVNLATLDACSGPPELSAGDIAVSEGDGMANFTIGLSRPSDQTVRVDYATADATATAPDDYTAVSGTLILAPGETGALVLVSIVDDGLSEGVETFMLHLSNPAGAVITDGAGVGLINDNEASACGAPAIDTASQRGLFLWRSCPDNTWHMRVTAAGPEKQVYTGRITAEQAFPSTPHPFSLERNDLLDAASRAISYTLNVRNRGQDGFRFETPESGAVCFEVNTPDDIRIFLGMGMDAVGKSVNLERLDSCSAIP